MWEVRIDGYKLVENSEDKWDVSSMTVEGRLASILSSRNIQVRCCGQQLPALLAKWVLLRSKLKKAYLFGKEVSLSLSIYIIHNIIHIQLYICITHTNIPISWQISV